MKTASYENGILYSKELFEEPEEKKVKREGEQFDISSEKLEHISIFNDEL